MIRFAARQDRHSKEGTTVVGNEYSDEKETVKNRENESQVSQYTDIIDNSRKVSSNPSEIQSFFMSILKLYPITGCSRSLYGGKSPPYKCANYDFVFKLCYNVDCFIVNNWHNSVVDPETIPLVHLVSMYEIYLEETLVSIIVYLFTH